MDVQAIIQRATAILKDPKGVWTAIRVEQQEPKSLLINYFLPLAGVAQLAMILKWSVVGTFGFRLPFATSLGSAIIQLILSVVFLYAFSFLLNTLAPKFGGQTTKEHCMALVAYSYTASFAGAVLILIPFLGWLFGIAGGIYALYTFYQGITPMTSVPNEQRLKYFAVNAVCMILISVVLNAILMPSMTPRFSSVDTPYGNVSSDDVAKATQDLNTIMKNFKAQAGQGE